MRDFFMEYIFKSSLKSGENSNSVIQKILLFALSLALLMTFSVWRSGIRWDQLEGQATAVERVKKTGDSEMSAVKFTTLPFILAFKHFIVEREE